MALNVVHDDFNLNDSYRKLTVVKYCRTTTLFTKIITKLMALLSFPIPVNYVMLIIYYHCLTIENDPWS